MSIQHAAESGAPRLASKQLRAAKLVAPVVAAAIIAMSLFSTTDSSQLLLSMLRATLGLALLGAVMGRQIAHILALEEEVEERADRLKAVTEVVSALNAAQNVGAALEVALERLTQVLQADAGAIWLPAAESEELLLVEHLGFEDEQEARSFLDDARAAAAAGKSQPFSRVPVDELALGQDLPGRILAVPLGKPEEGMGYLCIVRWEGRFGHGDGEVLQAVGEDIGAGLRSVRLISEARKLADHDPLTGLYNHRCAHQRLTQEVARAAASQQPLAVMMLDLDNFKLYNDTYGHPAGDEVLKRVTEVLKSVHRETDVICRYGGDEFLVLLPNATKKQALRVAERIRSSLARRKFKCQDSALLPIAFSYGIACSPEDGTDAGQLVSKADSNLYVSKNQGGNAITATGMQSFDAEAEQLTGFDMLQAMVTSVDNKDRYTARHSMEVVDYSLRIGRALGLDAESLETIRLSGLLHDVGKIGVPDSVLRKPGRLTDDEYAAMKQHPALGALIVGALPGMEHLVDGVRHHHERWDGGGYPSGLRGDGIPLVARIMAVADAYSAMTTSRPYRAGLSKEQALKETARCLGTQFDPQIGRVFIELMRTEDARELREHDIAQPVPGSRAAEAAQAAA